ncbi:hypothetical protein [Endozoicomonas sp. Mp262]|uniref:hypothetical protein n=1 Tax=Endozoicomonas sp. Mp262 TaxID=2919499 RepID=UPI0021D814F7
MTTFKLTASQATQIAGARAGRDFLVHLIACSQSKTAQKREGAFWKSQREWSNVDGGGFSRTAVRNHSKNLVSLGVLTVWSERDYSRIVGGIRTWYKVDIDRVKELVAENTGKAVNKVRKVAKKAKQVIRKGFDKAVEMGKNFTGQNEAKPQAAHNITYTVEHFAECSPFTIHFIDWLTFNKDSSKSAGTLHSFFSRYGFTSNYVQKAYKNFLGQWGGAVEERLIDQYGPAVFLLVADAQNENGGFRTALLIKQARSVSHTIQA